MNSALCGHADCVQLLIEAGADTEAYDDVRFVCSLCGQVLFAFVLYSPGSEFYSTLHYFVLVSLFRLKLRLSFHFRNICLNSTDLFHCERNS